MSSSDSSPQSDPNNQSGTAQIDTSSRHRAIRGPDQAPRVTVVAGPALGRRFVVEEESVVVGRSIDVDVRIEDSGVSRKHFRLIRDGLNVYVDDLDSSNGTFVNGQRIEEPRKLEEGDKIAIGVNTLFQVSWFETGETFDEAFERRMERMQADKQRLRDELAAAQDVQQSLLPPKRQSFGNLEVEALYHPCDELSGDFFDVVSVDPWVYVYVIDVTSHGVASAQVTYILRGLFTQILHSEAYDLKRLMTEVQSTYREYDVDYDAAYHVCRIHTDTGQVEYTRASVLPGIVQNSSGIQLVDAPPASALSSLKDEPAQPPEPVRFQLQPEENFIVCTDGCYEFEDTKGRQFGKRRLVKLLGRVGASDWSDTLLDTFVRAHGGREFTDDLTAVRLARQSTEETVDDFKRTTRTTSFPGWGEREDGEGDGNGGDGGRP